MHANQYFVYNATDLVGCLSHCNFAAAHTRFTPVQPTVLCHRRFFSLYPRYSVYLVKHIGTPPWKCPEGYTSSVHLQQPAQVIWEASGPRQTLYSCAAVAYSQWVSKLSSIFSNRLGSDLVGSSSCVASCCAALNGLSSTIVVLLEINNWCECIASNQLCLIWFARNFGSFPDSFFFSFVLQLKWSRLRAET